jgi:class 3 adenylate cyclase
MQFDDAIKLAASAVAILGAVIAVTRYITALQLRPTKEQHESETASLRERVAVLSAQHEAESNKLKDRIETLEVHGDEVSEKYQRLLEDLALARRVGTAALLKKAAIDEDLAAAAETLQASASSLLVRSPSLVPGQSLLQDELVFLSIAGPAAAKLRRTRVPIHNSIAGRVFTSGRAHLTPDAHADVTFYDKVDRASQYRTEDMLALPVRFDDEVIAVAQFLNKKGGARFKPDDVVLAELFAPSLAARIADFIQDPEHFEILGITLEREAEEATVLFCDLTNSSLLFTNLFAPVATDVINAYLELATDVVVAHGATVDQFLGDGAMIRFNVPRRVKDHAEHALQSALDLQRRFDELKGQWSAAGYPVSNIFSRIGIASGSVRQVSMGHPQFQHPTLMGMTVSLANALCEAGDRSMNVILVDDTAMRRGGTAFHFEPVARERLGKAGGVVQVAYSLIEQVNVEQTDHRGLRTQGTA